MMQDNPYESYACEDEIDPFRWSEWERASTISVVVLYILMIPVFAPGLICVGLLYLLFGRGIHHNFYIVVFAVVCTLFVPLAGHYVYEPLFWLAYRHFYPL